MQVALCLFVLRFYDPVKPIWSCWVRSVYLTTLLLGRLSPLSGKQVSGIVPILLPETDNLLPFLNQQKGENDPRKYFMVKSPRKNVADPAGVEPSTSCHQSDAHPTEPPRPAGRRMIRMPVRSSKTQISLCICKDWSESSLIPCAFYSLQTIQRRNPCHTGWMYRQIYDRVFASQTGFIVGFVTR